MRKELSLLSSLTPLMAKRFMVFFAFDLRTFDKRERDRGRAIKVIAISDLNTLELTHRIVLHTSLSLSLSLVWTKVFLNLSLSSWRKLKGWVERAEVVGQRPHCHQFQRPLSPWRNLNR
jgi:hypothetical protein